MFSFKSVLVASTFALAAAGTLSAQAAHDSARTRELRQDHREVRGDRRELKGDAREVAGDRRELRGDKREVAVERRDVRQDTRQLRAARAAHDSAAVRAARKDIRTRTSAR
jgi:hypothetical protein